MTVANYDSDATIVLKTNNTKAARLAVIKLAGEESGFVAVAVDNENYGKLSPKFSAQARVYWAAAEEQWKKARIRADQIGIWYKTALENPGTYYPLSPTWDPMRVSTGKAAPARSAEYAARQAAAKTNTTTPKLPNPNANNANNDQGPTLSVNPNLGGGLSTTTPPVLQNPGNPGNPATNPPLNEPPLGEPPIDPNDPLGGADPGPNGQEPGTPLPPGQGSPVALWLVPVGLVGALLWHLTTKGNK